VGVVGRLFVAVDPPAGTALLLAAALDGWADLPGKVARPGNWHFTLKFLGTVETVAFERLLAGLDEAVLGERFEVEVSGTGAFPNPRRAAVLWLGLTRGAGRMTELAEMVEEVGEGAGFERTDRPFHPHLTLSRIRPPEDVRRLIAREPPPPVRFVADEVRIVRSHLGRDGARYETLERFPLG
jgi:2'-5' RNA ligase